ncbi:MAG: lipopolysaccharide biosynthesis protein [Hyphomonadaceae bacterium]|nr:lipopolysaccharide biosynthesis protein [Hyphomonadaceae bacterium]
MPSSGSPTDAGEASKGHAFKGVALSGGAQIVRLAAQVVSVVLLARLLEPSDFGVFAMVMVIVNLGGLLQNFGLGQAVVQKQVLTSGQVGAVFWISSTLGVMLGAVVAATSPIVSTLYNEPRAGALSLGAAGLLAIAGIANAQLAILNRRMMFGALAAIDVASALVGLVVALTAAILGAREWALLLGTGSSQATILAGTWIASGWLPTERPDFRGVSQMLRFGSRVAASQIAEFVSRNADNALIGMFSGVGQLGLYDRAYKLLLFPVQQVNMPLGRVLLPILSRLQEEPERYRQVYLRAIRQVMLVTQPGIVFLGMSAPMLIDFLLGPKWAGAAPIFAWLAIAALHQPVSTTMNWLFISQGRADAYLVWSLFSAATCVLSFGIGLQWGAVGVAAAYALSDVLVRLPVLLWLVTRRGPVRLSQVLGAAAPFAAATLGSAGALVLLRGLHMQPAAASLLVGACCSYVVSISTISAFPTGRRALGDAASIVSSAVRDLRTVRRRKPI